MESAQYLGSSVGETLELPPEMVKSFFRLLGLYGVILGITSLTTCLLRSGPFPATIGPVPGSRFYRIFPKLWPMGFPATLDFSNRF